MNRNMQNNQLRDEKRLALNLRKYISFVGHMVEYVDHHSL